MSQPKPKFNATKLIHTLKGALQLDDDCYRAMLAEYGVASSKDLREAQAKVFIHDLEQKALAAGVWKSKGATYTPPQNKQGLMGKIEALLADAGRPIGYADAMARKMFNLESLRWCDSDQLRRIVAALTYDQKRRAEKSQPNPGAHR